METIKLVALFPVTKMLNYCEAVHFENYVANLNIPDTIRVLGIDPFFLDKFALPIHPKDLLITKPNLDEIEDSQFKQLFSKSAQVYKIDLDLDLSEILFPLTSTFVSRFETLGIEWLNNYFLTLSDYDINSQTRISIAEFFKLQQLDETETKRILELFIKKFVWAVNIIKARHIANVEKIDNPFFIDPDPMSYETK